MTTDLLENGEGSLGRLLESNALVVGLLQRLLGALAAAADGLGVELEIGAARVHVEQLGTVLIHPDYIRAWYIDSLSSFKSCFIPSKEDGHSEWSGHDADVVVRVPEGDGEVGDCLGHGLHLHLLVVGEPVILTLHPGSVDQSLGVCSQTFR